MLGVTLTAAIWIYTYRVWSVSEWIGRDGRPFHPALRVRISPWWGAYATIAVILIGVGASLWLLPERRRLTERLATRFVKPS